MGFPDAYRQISSLVKDFKENEKQFPDHQLRISNKQTEHFANQLNRKFYQLYVLTKEEIKIVEGE